MKGEDDRGGPVPGLQPIEHPPHGLRAHERNVSVEDEDIARKAGQRALRLLHRVGGAVLRILDRDDAAERRDQRLDLLGLVADHDHRLRWIQFRHAGEQVAEHRSPGNRMHHLVQIRFHPRALAGGEDDGGDGRGHGARTATERLPFP